MINQKSANIGMTFITCDDNHSSTSEDEITSPMNDERLAMFSNNKRV